MTLIAPFWGDGLSLKMSATHTKSAADRRGLPQDFDLSATLDAKVLAHIEDYIASALKKFKASADADLNAAQAKLDTWKASDQPKLDGYAAKVKELEAHKSPAELKLAQMQANLNKQNSIVSHLDQEIETVKAEKAKCRSGWRGWPCRNSIGPLGYSGIGPLGHSDIGPLGYSGIGPLGHLGIGPLGYLGIGPLGHLGIGPLGHLGIGPVSHFGIWPLGYFGHWAIGLFRALGHWAISGVGPLGYLGIGPLGHWAIRTLHRCAWNC